LEWPVESYRSRLAAFVHAAAAIPAFIRVKDDGSLALLRVGDKDIQGTIFYTLVAPVANLGIEDYRSVGSSYVGNRVDLVFCHMASFNEMTIFLRQMRSDFGRDLINAVSDCSSRPARTVTIILSRIIFLLSGNCQ
jgi:hypothetical protein